MNTLLSKLLRVLLVFIIMSNKIKYSAALFISLAIGLVGANTIQPSTYSYCAYAVGSLDNCNMNFTAIDKDKTFSDQVQKGLLFGSATGVLLFGGINIFSRS